MASLLRRILRNLLLGCGITLTLTLFTVTLLVFLTHPNLCLAGGSALTYLIMALLVGWVLTELAR